MSFNKEGIFRPKLTKENFPRVYLQSAKLMNLDKWIWMLTSDTNAKMLS